MKAAPAPPGIYYIYADHLNTPRLITDTANTTVWRWSSDPFGTDVANEDVDGDGRRFSYNLRFPGQYFDKETALHYNYQRDGYDPSTGGYTQSDPFGLFGGSLSTYAYAANNPLSYTDPTGEAISLGIPIVIGGGVIVIGAMISQSNQNSKNGAIPTTTSSSQEKCCTVYKNVYQANSGKHGSTSYSGPRGTIGAEPINGAAVLVTSVGAGNARIGYDPSTGQLVKFRLTQTDEEKCIKYWHGYVVSQTDLYPADWEAGRNAGFPNWPRKPK